MLPGHGANCGDAVGQAVLTDELRARRCCWPPLRLARVCCEHESVVVVCPAALQVLVVEGRGVRGFGLDVHRDFCEVAISERGRVRSAGRVATRVEALEVFAQSLGPDDIVALEATSGSDKIVEILQRHEIRVVVANTRKLRSITEAKAKTDRLDARALARLLMAGLLDGVWTPDERTRALRRLTNHRERVKSQDVV